MERAVIVTGRIIDSRHIELDEPAGAMKGSDLAALRRIEEEWRAQNPGEIKSKEEIDRYLEEERASWDD